MKFGEVKTRTLIFVQKYFNKSLVYRIDESHIVPPSRL